MLLDAVFRPTDFLNEITWKRTLAHGSARRCGPVHDTILFYAKTDAYFWFDQKIGYDTDYVESHFGQTDEASGKPVQAISLTGAGVRHGDSGKPWRDFDPTSIGRHWALPAKITKKLGIVGATVQERLDKLDAAGRIYWPKKAGGRPRLKWFLDDSTGAVLPDVWTDIPPINSQARERLGYPTQKPLALMERIITASTAEGDVVLDPFCGCGTTIDAAQRLKRRWIGIDITHLAIGLIKYRLRNAYGPGIERTYEVHGEPVDLSGARKLAEDDKYEFQAWSLGLVGARRDDQKKGADKGIDGRLYFHDEGGKTKGIVLSVKGGHLKANDVRDLRGVIEREGATMGVLISLGEPTAAMRKEAASAGFYTSPWDGKKYPRLQLRTVEELLGGHGIEYPARAQTNVTHKKAPRAVQEGAIQLPLVEEDSPPYGDDQD